MTWKLRLQYIAILIVICIGFAFPLVWLFLILLVQTGKNKEIKDNQQRYKESPDKYYDVYIPPIGMEGTKARIYSIDYAEYRKSPQWNARRKAVLKRDNYTCQQCKDTDIPLDVHHTTYERIGDEDLSDLVSVCRPCHDEIHAHWGYDKLGKFPLL